MDDPVVESMACVCGAREGQPCKNRHGNEREQPHPRRIKMYWEMVELWQQP